MDMQVCFPGNTVLRCLFVSRHLMASPKAQTTQNALRKCSAAELKLKRDACSETSAVCRAVRRREFLDAHRKAFNALRDSPQRCQVSSQKFWVVITINVSLTSLQELTGIIIRNRYIFS